MTPFLLMSAVLAADPATYAKPDLLIEAEAVIKNGKTYRILDVRPAAVGEGFIPGAVMIPLMTWNKAMIDGKADEAFWKAELAKVGVEPKRTTIVTGMDVRESCRAWWLLKYAGVSDVRILNGGQKAYVEAGGKLVADSTATALPHDWKRDMTRVSNKTDLIVSVEDKLSQIIDARSSKEYTGEQKLSKKGGHVPGAAALEWKDVLDSKTDRFKSAAELKELFAKRKIDTSKTCTTYCQSGGRASVMAFALELMGAKNVKNYYRSWSEWGNAEDTPIAKP